MARKLAAGNWKMNGTGASLAEIEALAKAYPNPGCDMLICPPATLLSRLSERTSGTTIKTGGQDCHAATSGAHTGDISAEMIADAGGSHVIVGHSERRADHGETDSDIAAKTAAVWRAGLVAVICLGETLAEREAGQTIDVVASQLSGSVPDGADGDNTVIAYEPVWAIGTGKVPTLDEIAAVHADIRSRLKARFGAAGDDMPILYGGSVKPSNADEIFGVADVDGALVGGASLKAEDFGGIVAALERA
ncbi:triose-phosphate isomerase [Boseongicola aestuarii]|uniref:Triosephosphate isomerase n=1 Tax=Boseongicola aestuarii TaxID=1470561 RepID=A0A238IVG4_9RHOB|nr:triose-phosphate isomerase [Boseongicola aestuarii]SMX22377.1 Triosephosphate isomerase [Boseongicola aestuarii]